MCCNGKFNYPRLVFSWSTTQESSCVIFFRPRYSHEWSDWNLSDYIKNIWFADQSVISLACDGPYLFLLSSNGLFKIGSGLGSTVSGRSYNFNRKILPSSEGVLLYFNVTHLFCFSVKVSKCNRYLSV